MQHLECAIATSQALSDVLEEEIARARSQRDLIQNFASQALLDRAVLRENFNRIVNELQVELAKHLTAVGEEFGLASVTVEALSQVANEPAARLVAGLARIRASASTLSELDALNRQLAQRANAMVRGYLSALTGNSAIYNQRGETRPHTGSTYSGRA